MKKTEPKQNGTSNAPSALDLRIFAALRQEVQDLAALLAREGASLSPKLLASCAQRLREVARFTETFEAHGIPANGVAIAPDGEVTPVRPEAPALTDRDGRIHALRNEKTTWREICKRFKLTVAEARQCYKRAERALAKAAV